MTDPVSPLPCSRQWDDEDLPAWGTASAARFWLAVEQPGPWGRAANVDSQMPVGLGAELDGACTRFGGRLLLIRRPRRADADTDERTVLLAGGPSHDRWLLEGVLDDPHRLLMLPWHLLVDADPDAVSAVLPELEEIREARLLVCTNGKRDTCCAVRGRPVAAQAAQARGGQVWECSHTGGHRYAPTAVALPSGQMWGRLDPEQALQVLDAESRRHLPAELLGPRHHRGRSDLSAPEQVAEAWWQHRRHLSASTALRTEQRGSGPVENSWLVTVSDDDGTHEVLVVRESGPLVSDSCGKDAKPAVVWTVRD